MDWDDSLPVRHCIVCIKQDMKELALWCDYGFDDGMHMSFVLVYHTKPYDIETIFHQVIERVQSPSTKGSFLVSP